MIQSVIGRWRAELSTRLRKIREEMRRAYASAWGRLYRLQYRTSVLRSRHGLHAFGGLLLVLVGCNIYFLPRIQAFLQVEINDGQIEPLRGLLVNIGGPLIGAAAIVSSLVMFAMQINIERMPHGLFRRLSSDFGILSAFAISFVLAIGIACLSMIVDKSRLGIAASVALWAILCILLSFLYAYRRALLLVNPLQQLRMVLSDAQGELAKWARRAERAVPLLRTNKVAKLEVDMQSPPDLARMTFFNLNAHWTDGAKRAVGHAISFARRYSESGDYEVARGALRVVLGVNQAYIQAKGNTFFASNGIFENPLTTDGFLNDSLEHLRQLSRASIARGDEQQIEQTLRALAGIANVYLGISYPSTHAPKTHAQLAAGYLTEAVKSVIPANLPDVLMEGVDLMGQTALGFLAHGRPNGVVALSEGIALIGSTGVAKENYRPVTLRAMAQLANITFDLLRVRNQEVRFALGQVREDVSMLANFFLTVPDTPLRSTHSMYLGPYYSSTSQEGLRHRLGVLVNALSDSKLDNNEAKTIIDNIAEWSDKLPKAEKALLLVALKAKSHFVFDVLHWITGIAEILLAASTLPPCSDRSRAQLREQATRLVRLVDWIPDDKDTVTFIENYRLSEMLFEAASDALYRDCKDVAEEVFKVLLSWTFKAGRERTGWGTLEDGLFAAAVLAANEGAAWQTKLRTIVGEKLADLRAPDQEARDAAASDLLDKAESLYPHQYPISRLQGAISHTDLGVLRPILREIANRLSPGAAGDQGELAGTQRT